MAGPCTLGHEMDAVLLLLSAALCCVFAVAGVTKLVDLGGSRSAVGDFGVPKAFAGAIGTALPFVELALAGALLSARGRWYGAVGAVALLAAFCCAIAVAMTRDKRPTCRCFGHLHATPVGGKTLARNGVLVAVALFVVVAAHDDPGPSAFAWTSQLDAAGWGLVALAIVLLTTIAVAALAVVYVLRTYGRVLVRLERIEDRLRAVGLELDEPEDMPELGLAPGTEAPSFSLDSVDSGRVGLDALLEPERPLLLLFTSPTCGPCSVLMPKVAEWQREHAEELTVALLSAGDADEVRAEASAHDLRNVLLDADLAMYEAYQANGTPSAVLVRPDGTIASWLAAGSDWIESLVDQTIGVSGPAIGSELPSIALSTPEGADVVLSDTVKGPTVLLFWNPGCGYCRSMHDDVRKWEESRPHGSPELVVVSAGAAEEVRAEGFTSRVVLDPDWSASSALGADGTPMAVLVDGEGRIASTLVTGAASALELLGVGGLSPVR